MKHNVDRDYAIREPTKFFHLIQITYIAELCRKKSVGKLAPSLRQGDC